MFSASWSLPHSSITKASLTETQTIASTPCCLNTRRQLVVARQVGRRAGRREGAGQREHDDGFAFENIVREISSELIVDTGLESDLRNGFALEVFGIRQHGESFR